MPRTWLIAGASGIVGRYVVKRLLERESRLRILSFSGGKRNDQGLEVIPWDPPALRAGGESAMAPIVEAMEGVDVVLNLAGHGLGSGRLGPGHRQLVLQSRIDATRSLVEAWQRAGTKPSRWLQASAVGYYGDTGSALIAEDCPPGNLFLSEVCQRWEAEVESIASAGCLTSLLRLGIVLAEDAPAVIRMLRPVRLGLGGRLGSGEQFWPWMTAADVASSIEYLAGIEHVGPLNLVAPEAVSQIEFTQEMARALGRPSWLWTPGMALRLVTGGVVDELILPSCRAQADALLATGFEFEHPTLAEAAKWMFRRP